MCTVVASTSACPAPPPGPPPPTLWPQPVSCASPVIVPFAARSNSTQPQKSPRSFPQKVGLSQLNDRPTCHVSWLDPPPYAPADEANPADSATAAASAANITNKRRITLPFFRTVRAGTKRARWLTMGRVAHLGALENHPRRPPSGC